MTIPLSDTQVTYPTGSLTATAQELHIEALPDDRRAVLLDVTSAHPVDAGWPDQGPDRAVLRVGETEIPLVDCIVGATDGTALYIGADIPVAKGTDGWAFVVAHIIDRAPTNGSGDALTEGCSVDVIVDASYRRLVSAGHTGCHAASLALNLAVADRWKKEVRTDSLGTPDFDGLAIDVSLIHENGSTDTYRLGKSLRKKGFMTEGLVAGSSAELTDIENRLNATLAEWVAADAAVHIDIDGPGLTDRRYWVCDLPAGSARIPCGGTHLASLGELGQASVALALAETDGTLILTMETTVNAVAVA
ncbi:metal-dependent hydrolase [Leifsonia sp. A12D58]|uniref:metal-dependent hydrolase n=1 Tax=Leifsonia sp. A12D58 TaxID=3397674 RepID=UPI0039E0C67B